MNEIETEKPPESLEDLILLIDQTFQDGLYEKFTSGLVSATEFRLLNRGLHIWQTLSQELLSVII